MTLATVFADLQVFALLLLAGVVIRELVPPLQKLFLPASIIGGVLGLILGQQVLGLITIPEAFSDVTSVSMKVIMSAIPIGVAISGKRLAEHMDFALGNIILFGGQMVIGTLVGVACMGLWPGLPEGWGLLGVFAYFGSHGSAGSAASILEDLGVAGAMDIGMVMATIGVLVSMIVGMIMVNIGVRKGWATFVKEPTKQPKEFYRGILPQEKREPIGFTSTTPTSVTQIAFQLAILLLSYTIGEWIFKFLISFFPVLSHVSSMLYGIIGGMILWWVMCKTKTSGYVDKKTISSISNFCLELVILTACATLDLDLITTYAVPILLHALVCCGITLIFAFFWFKKIHNPEWFEKFLMVFGMCTGSNAQGYALVRAIDPDGKSCIYEALGVYNAVFFWHYVIQPVVCSTILTTLIPTLGIGAALVIVPLIMAAGIFRGLKKSSSSS